MSTDANMPERSVWGQQAVDFAKQSLMQRSVKLEIEHIDKYGICHGILFINNKNFATSLVAMGLGYLSTFGRPSKMESEVKETEAKA